MIAVPAMRMGASLLKARGASFCSGGTSKSIKNILNNAQKLSRVPSITQVDVWSGYSEQSSHCVADLCRPEYLKGLNENELTRLECHVASKVHWEITAKPSTNP